MLERKINKEYVPGKSVKELKPGITFKSQVHAVPGKSHVPLYRKMACTITFILRTFLILLFIVTFSQCAKEKSEENVDKDKWKKKDVRDYTDADIERLYDEWEVK